MIEHLPLRRTWLCAVCRRDWPCQTARTSLLEEYADAPVALAVYLASAFVEACGELDDVDAGLLHRRFLGWLRLRVPP